MTKPTFLFNFFPTQQRVLLISFALIVTYLLPSTLVSAADSDKCAANSQFTCPNCGGITVSDCKDCDGYLFSDYKYELCYDRKLFNQNAENGDSDNHYPFLWCDM